MSKKIHICWLRLVVVLYLWVDLLSYYSPCLVVVWYFIRIFRIGETSETDLIWCGSQWLVPVDLTGVDTNYHSPLSWLYKSPLVLSSPARTWYHFIFLLQNNFLPSVIEFCVESLGRCGHEGSLDLLIVAEERFLLAEVCDGASGRPSAGEWVRSVLSPSQSNTNNLDHRTPPVLHSWSPSNRGNASTSPASSTSPSSSRWWCTCWWVWAGSWCSS